MITLADPISNAPALDRLTGKPLLPSALNAKEMVDHASPALRERAFFSSRVLNTQLLQEFKNGVESIVKGESNVAQQRLRLKELLASLDYRPAPGTQGKLKDLSSNVRLNLILRMNTSLVRNFGIWQQRNRPGELKAFPALELLRVSPRVNKRAWIERWNEALDFLGDLTTATEAAGDEETDEDGINAFALKNDPIWEAISAFGLPYPPFDFNSGMGTRAVSYEEAVEVGVMKADFKQKPAPERSLNEGLEASMGGIDDDLVKVLEGDLSDDVEFLDGVLRFKNDLRIDAMRDRVESVLALMNNNPNWELQPREHGHWVREFEIKPHPGLFRALGIPKGKIFGDGEALAKKHPDEFKNGQEVKAHAEYVFARPTHILPGAESDHRMIVRQSGDGDKASMLEIQLRGGKYRIRSCYTLAPGQLATKIGKSAGQVVTLGNSRVDCPFGQNTFEMTRHASRRASGGHENLTSAAALRQRANFVLALMNEAEPAQGPAPATSEPAAATLRDRGEAVLRFLQEASCT